MEKKKVYRQITEFDENILYGNANGVIEKIQEFIETCKKNGYENITFEHKQYYDYSEVVAFGVRLETDEELDERIKKQDKELLKQQKKLERERQKYQELKRKFEKQEESKERFD